MGFDKDVLSELSGNEGKERHEADVWPFTANPPLLVSRERERKGRRPGMYSSLWRLPSITSAPAMPKVSVQKQSAFTLLFTHK